VQASNFKSWHVALDHRVCFISVICPIVSAITLHCSIPAGRPDGNRAEAGHRQEAAVLSSGKGLWVRLRLAQHLQTAPNMQHTHLMANCRSSFLQHELWQQWHLCGRQGHFHLRAQRQLVRQGRGLSAGGLSRSDAARPCKCHEAHMNCLTTPYTPEHMLQAGHVRCRASWAVRGLCPG
jgi:hypothetical protein